MLWPDMGTERFRMFLVKELPRVAALIARASTPGHASPDRDGGKMAQQRQSDALPLVVVYYDERYLCCPWLPHQRR